MIAHPWGRRGGTVLDASAFSSLKDIGLAGIEVDHQDHPPELRTRLRAIAADLDLVVTGSSDHHGLGKVDHDLGVNTTDPEQYERLISLARLPVNAASSEIARTWYEQPFDPAAWSSCDSCGAV